MSRTSLVSVTAKWVPEEPKYDPYWDGVIEVVQEGPKGPCSMCGGDQTELAPEPPEPIDYPEDILGSFTRVHEGAAVGRLCDACAVEEEISQTGLEDLIIPEGFVGPKFPALVTFKGRLFWDCTRDYWTGCDECEATFENEGEPIVELEQTEVLEQSPVVLPE